MTREPGRAPPRDGHGDLTSLAPHERLPEILVVPREKIAGRSLVFLARLAPGLGLARLCDHSPQPAGLQPAPPAPPGGQEQITEKNNFFVTV